jgi:hypothetical protein
VRGREKKGGEREREKGERKKGCIFKEVCSERRK